jgi:hypothetical protein
MKLPSWWLRSAAALACVAGACAAEADADITIVPSGLRLIAPAAAADESVRAFNWSLPDWSSGTALALLVSCPKGGLIQFDGAASTLTKFADDKGTDLLAKPPASSEKRKLPTIGFSLSPKVSQDGKFCALEVCSPCLPAKGAARIRLEGVVTMLCASEKKEHVQKDVPLQKFAKFAAPNLELSVYEVGKPDVGDEPLGLTLRAYRDLDEVAEIRFFKADGTEIKSRRTGTSRMGLLGAVTVDWSYNLAEKVDAATIKLFVWSDLKKKQVPFSLDVDVGSF